MSNSLVRGVGYTGSVQELIWSYGNSAQVNAYLWGGGGGGGGNDSRAGGYGEGGGYAAISFTVNNGDTIKIAVGGGGGAGLSSTRGGGGSAGASWVPEVVFNTRTATGSVPTIPYSNPAYCSFLNTYGVWVNPISAGRFDVSYSVTFPSNGLYTVTASADNYGTVYIDGASVLSVPTYTYSVTTTTYVTAGTHIVRLLGINTGGPGSFGTVISGGSSYSGGAGGGAGPYGISGAGGGGGGSTLLLVNDSPVAVAAGGGGGGGGGNSGAATGQNAPGSRGQSGSDPAGQNGQDQSGDGGGGGAGGGGQFGGQGGSIPGGDQGGYAGVHGTSQGSTVQDPNGRTPGGTGSTYYQSGIAQGGFNTQPGTTGYAVFEFNLPSIFVNQGGTYVPVSNVWVKQSGVWQNAKSIWVNQSGTWNQVLGGLPPGFTSISGNFGSNPRPYS